MPNKYFMPKVYKICPINFSLMNHANNNNTNSESTHATHHDFVYNPTRHLGQFYRFVNERDVQTAG